jgi:uncharacterized damage-inducible protein DinB
MRRIIRQLFVVAGLTAALLAPVRAAQSADPISGTWAATLMPTGGATINVTFDLKFDGRSAVAGTVSGGPAGIVVKTGSFDPKTGWLKLALGDSGSAKTALTLEGTLANGVISGKGTDEGGGSGTFSLKREGAAPQAAASDTSLALKKTFGEVSGWITTSASLVPAEKYTYKPVGTVRSFGEMVGHVVDGYNYYCGLASGKALQWSDATEKGKTDKATLAAALKKATDACSTVYNGTGKVAPMLENVAHSNLHYGNLVTYLRMLGIKPPSS